MKKLTAAALVAAMGIATSATAQQRAQAPRQSVKTPSQVTAPKATGQATQSNTDALLGAAKTLNGQNKLSPAVSAGTCDTVNSLVKSVSSVLSGSQKTAFMNAIASINYNGQEIIQACKAKQPITDQGALKNLGLVVIEVGGKVQRNEAVASDVNVWGNALSKVIGVSQAEGLEKAKGLASGECGLLNVSI